MPTERRSHDDSSDLIEYITSKGNRMEKSVQVPSPDGRTQGGWVAIQNLKVQPEVMTQLEQLREHPVFRGHWKTAAQVAWSMIYLGLCNMHEFLDDPGTEGWSQFKSAFRVMDLANALETERRRESILTEATTKIKQTLISYLDQDTPFAKYKAWKGIERAIEGRDSVEDTQKYDQLMLNGVPSVQSALFLRTEVAEIWRRLFPVPGGDLDHTAYDELYTIYTEPYFEELAAIRNAQEEEDA